MNSDGVLLAKMGQKKAKYSSSSMIRRRTALSGRPARRNNGLRRCRVFGMHPNIKMGQRENDIENAQRRENGLTMDLQWTNDGQEMDIKWTRDKGERRGRGSWRRRGGETVGKRLNFEDSLFLSFSEKMRGMKLAVLFGGALEVLEDCVKHCDGLTYCLILKIK